MPTADLSVGPVPWGTSFIVLCLTANTEPPSFICLRISCLACILWLSFWSHSWTLSGLWRFPRIQVVILFLIRTWVSNIPLVLPVLSPMCTHCHSPLALSLHEKSLLEATVSSWKPLCLFASVCNAQHLPYSPLRKPASFFTPFFLLSTLLTQRAGLPGCSPGNCLISETRELYALLFRCTLEPAIS